MIDMRTIIQQCLEMIGLGPARTEIAMNGAELFGRAGILNSLEFVQFVAAIGEITKVDVFELLDGLDFASANVFSNIESLSSFLGQRDTANLPS